MKYYYFKLSRSNKNAQSSNLTTYVRYPEKAGSAEILHVNHIAGSNDVSYRYRYNKIKNGVGMSAPNANKFCSKFYVRYSDHNDVALFEWNRCILKDHIPSKFRYDKTTNIFPEIKATASAAYEKINSEDYQKVFDSTKDKAHTIIDEFVAGMSTARTIAIDDSIHDNTFSHFNSLYNLGGLLRKKIQRSISLDMI